MGVRGKELRVMGGVPLPLIVLPFILPLGEFSSPNVGGDKLGTRGGGILGE